MPGMSWKLALVWLGCVLVGFAVVLGSSDSSSDSNPIAMWQKTNANALTALAPILPDDKPQTEACEFGVSDQSSPTSSAPNTNSIEERMRFCLKRLNLFHFVVGSPIVEHLYSDNSIDWTLELGSMESRMQLLEDLHVEVLIDYLCTLLEMPGVVKVATKYMCEKERMADFSCYIIPDLNSICTSTGEESMDYRQCLKDLKPLKRITSLDRMIICGESTEDKILDQLELLLYLLRIMDVPAITIDWIDKSKVLLDAESMNRFRPLLKDIPEGLRRREISFDVRRGDNHEFWDAFLKLIKEHYDIEE
ncbi:hypothetical protein NEHOM01_2488 [Nematocida homosporus]|uniref:uncharacterized protein n=1 Tax=Nematocida homosporus TaxID=1912981 RepID=UPI0022208405|nr:uncharacterized protein NEHOM01_2488 [Nematocida homosporus]KAI5188011.1 hypothetical protein NEHOM01_2488 [Nematocida homosporus]